MSIKDQLEELKLNLRTEELKLYFKDKLSDYYDGKKEGISIAMNLINNINMNESESIKMNKCKVCNITQPEHRINENNICITCERDSLLRDLGLKRKNEINKLYGIDYNTYAYGGMGSPKLVLLSKETEFFQTESDMLKAIIRLKEKNDIDGIIPFTTEINRVKYEI
jgi:hypothetical protein